MSDEAKVQQAEGTAAAEAKYPDPRSLERVLLFHRDHARIRLLRFLAELEREDYIRPLECLAGESIRDRMVHIVDAEGFWMSVLQNRVHDGLRPADYPDVDALVPRSHEATDRTLNLLHTADADWFIRQSLFSLPGRSAPVPLIPSMVVLHVLTHEFHHKGQICAAARSIGYEPPDLDLI
jgi:uncharacterized damage-inducible protein DinB